MEALVTLTYVFLSFALGFFAREVKEAIHAQFRKCQTTSKKNG